MKVNKNLFLKIADPENLFLAWDEFKRGKRNKEDVLRFETNLEQHIFGLSRHLDCGEYTHGPYEHFKISDPKLRDIYKAIVRDRILHHAIFTVINKIFEPTFISSSFSCRVDKGTHRGVKYLAHIIRKVSKNYTKRCFVLKCDIRRFFDKINRTILLKIIEKKIKDRKTLWLLEEIIESYFPFLRERERE